VAFLVQSDQSGWRVTNGSLAFGPYSTQAKAQDAAQSLSRTYATRQGFAEAQGELGARPAPPRFRRRAD
jgi:hypothetical protein